MAIWTRYLCANNEVGNEDESEIRLDQFGERISTRRRRQTIRFALGAWSSSLGRKSYRVCL